VQRDFRAVLRGSTLPIARVIVRRARLIRRIRVVDLLMVVVGQQAGQVRQEVREVQAQEEVVAE
jgi:hypothetical protein